jgi:hypothetical protein
VAEEGQGEAGYATSLCVIERYICPSPFATDKILRMDGTSIRAPQRVYDVENQGKKLALVTESELELGEDAPMTMAVYPKVCMT